MVPATIFLQNQNFIDALYIVAFSMFIIGLSGLTGPRTAVRGNQIAAVGMAIAFVATLLTPHVLSGSGTPELMAEYSRLALDAGARIIGGCCGTSAAHLAGSGAVPPA